MSFNHFESEKTNHFFAIIASILEQASSQNPKPRIKDAGENKIDSEEIEKEILDIYFSDPEGVTIAEESIAGIELRFSWLFKVARRESIHLINTYLQTVVKEKLEKYITFIDQPSYKNISHL